MASALGFAALNDGQVNSPQTFLKAASNIEFTFNWFYVDAHHQAFFSSGRLPVRAPGTNPTLPTYGTGQYEWRGFLTPAQHPHAIDPANATLINWNNQPAPGWGAASDNWGEGPIDHVLLLSGGVNGDQIQPQDLVGAMNNAATQDPVGALVWPVIKQVLAGGPAPDALSATAAQLVDDWVSAGSHIVDLNGDGKVDMPGATIMAKVWPGIVNAVLSPVLGNLTSIIPGDGDMSYVDKDLRTELGLPVQGRYSREFLRERFAVGLPGVAVAGDPVGGERAGDAVRVEPGHLAGARAAGHVRPRRAAGHDAVHQPPDLPAGGVVRELTGRAADAACGRWRLGTVRYLSVVVIVTNIPVARR